MSATHESTPSRPSYLWWFLANTLALCFAVVSWLGCLHVFGNPEIPRNYALLKRLGRLPEIEHHTVLDAPNASSLDAKGQYERYHAVRGEKLQYLNSRLIRNYLKNFERPLLLTYIQGEYVIEESRLLREDDFVAEGFVVRARAMVKPDEFSKALAYPVLIDYIFPTCDIEAIKAFREGDVLDVKKSFNCAAILHVDHIEEEGQTLVCLTVLPIAYGPYQVGGNMTFEISPPDQVSPGAKFPLLGE